MVRVERPVSTRYEIAAGMRKTSDAQGPALWFENVQGCDMPVVGAVYATRGRLLQGIGWDRKEFLTRYMERIKHPIEPRIVKTGPCKEVILTGKDATFERLPICLHHELDAGYFITMGVQIAKDPEYGRNTTMSRMQVLDDTASCMSAPPTQHLGMYLKRAEARGKSLPVAVALGTDPFFLLASQVKGPIDLDECAVAGALMAKPIEMVRCETFDVEVPANSEIVLEGEIVPGERRMEGPFGEYPGYYQEPSEKPVWKLKAITHRRNPVYLAGLTGMPVTDNHVLKAAAFEAMLYQRVKAVCHEVRDVCFTAGGGMGHHAVISIRPQYRGQARAVMLAAMQLERLSTKRVIVVDDDIDPHDPFQVEWALAFRMQASRDVVIIPNLPGGALDPSCEQPFTSDVMGIDATVPFGKPYARVASVPGAKEFKIPAPRKRAPAGG